MQDESDMRGERGKRYLYIHRGGARVIWGEELIPRVDQEGGRREVPMNADGAAVLGPRETLLPSSLRSGQGEAAHCKKRVPL